LPPQLLLINSGKARILIEQLATRIGIAPYRRQFKRRRWQQSGDRQFIALADATWRQLKTENKG
jgi:hypothetical protein